MSDEKGIDDKVLCVPCEDPNWSHIDSLEDLPQQLREEIAHFYAIYKQPEGIGVSVDGWQSREEALAVIEAARRRYLAQGIGLAVAPIGLAFGHNPIERR